MQHVLVLLAIREPLLVIVVMVYGKIPSMVVVRIMIMNYDYDNSNHDNDYFVFHTLLYYHYPLETLMCPADNGWVGAANQVVIRDCPPGYKGTRTRRCNAQGVWNAPNESGCEEVRCPAFGEWSSMLMGEVQVRVCETGGFALLTCGENGEWEGSPSVCCTYK